MTIVISALRTELLTGSFASLYSAFVPTRDLNAMGTVINTPGLTGSSITVGTVTALDIQQCVVAAEYIGLTQPQRDLWNALVTTAVTGIAISNTLIRAQTAVVWSAATVTRSNLALLQTRSCSRGETLFGENTVVDLNSLYVAITQP